MAHDPSTGPLDPASGTAESDPVAALPSTAALERAAAAALVPLESRRDDGWLLRANAGVTRRGNSVLAAGAGADALDAKIGRAERFYRARDLPPRFQLSPASLPPGVDAALAARGYAFEEGAQVMLARADLAAEGATAAAGAELHEVGTQVALEPTGPYLAVLAEVFGRAAEQAPARAAALRARGLRPLHVTALLGDAPVAAGLVVVDGALAGLFSVGTLPALRGRGLGASVVRALAGAALDAGARWLYLQVAAGNASAVRLYRRTGFAEAHRYHYRVAP